MNELELYIDGASKGNPGPAGIGVVVCRNNEVVENISKYIGKTTNNISEYSALISALEYAQKIKAKRIKVYTDSELLYRQIKRIYKIKNQNIFKMYQKVQELSSFFEEFSLHKIPREQNRGADKLANLAIKKYQQALY